MEVLGKMRKVKLMSTRDCKAENTPADWSNSKIFHRLVARSLVTLKFYSDSSEVASSTT